MLGLLSFSAPRWQEKSGCAVHSPEQIHVPRIRTQLIEHRPARKLIHYVDVLVNGAVQDFERTILIAQTGIDYCEVIRRDVPFFCQSLLLVEYFQRLVTLTRHSVSIGQYRISIPSFGSVVERDGFLQFRHSILIHPLGHVSLAKEKVELRIVRILLQGAAVSVNSSVILACNK